ncbi:VOC family protein [Sulfitobacter sp. S190]|uniref:VOC family protein n=1 Tax=Sulfitobacter sp. S190 TaxID=2867022 RepID=UPI0021A35AF6|nr:VOC family protein [Sulfitobacter sp. S190]UWR21517.1 VOC family protein [Sulfitobacter sp. S190]
MITLDHLAVAGMTRAAASAYASDALGVALQPGGEHAVFHTHNDLLGMADGLYLEAIAINPDAPKPDRARWFDLDNFTGPPRLTNWICRCDDLDATLAALPDGFGRPVDLQRGALRWRMAVPDGGILPFDNCAPALIEWQGGAHPVDMLAPSQVTLDTLTVHHPDADALRGLLAPFLSDDRIGFARGDAAVSARLMTPGGLRQL